LVRLVAAVVIAAMALRPALAAPAEEKQPEAAKPLAWLGDLAEAQRRAKAERKPVLVRVGATWCGPCRELSVEIEKPQAQSELRRWVLVELDVEHLGAADDELNVMSIPALRIRTAAGEAVDSRDGLLSADELVAWLKKNYEAARPEIDESLLATGEPDAAAVVRLVRQFQQRSPAVREAAIRRLAPYPKKARDEVLRAFEEGNLAARLASLELLAAWHAPVGEIDPWQPATVTKQRIAALRTWSEHFRAGNEPPEKLSAAQLARASADLDRMLKADAKEADAIRQRLAGLRAALLPEVTARLKKAAADQDRQRLLVLRYHLVAGDALVLRWPGGLERLAASDPRQRQAAAEQLARLATAAEEPLLVEMFSDPDPLVRELSLRGLQNVGGQEATSALLKLLADPEPNVRAAVLKQLEEKPQRKMVPKVAEYLKTEKDADLIVHAIRFLRAAGGTTAVETLLPLLKHESWQIRAEAAEAFSNAEHLGAGPRSILQESRGEVAEKLQAEAYAALLELLEDRDDFVVSQALDGLTRVDMVLAVDPLVRAASQHPDLAPKVVEMLAQGAKMRVRAVPHLRTFRKHADPVIRAAALRGLCEAVPAEMEEQITAGLQDPSAKVRIAAAGFLAQSFDSDASQARQKMQQESSGNPVMTPVTEAPALPAPASSLTTMLRNLIPSIGAPASAPAPSQKAAKQQKEGKEDAEPPEPSWDLWLREFYAGKHRGKWTSGLVGPLEKMFQAKDGEERWAAVALLVPLGKAPPLVPLLEATVRNDHRAYYRGGHLLPWLVWEERLKLFGELRRLAPDADAVTSLLSQMAEVPDARLVELFWQMLADPKVTPEQASQMQWGILSVYHVERWGYDPFGAGSGKNPRLKRLARDAAARSTAGTEIERLVALCLLTYGDPEAAYQRVKQLQADARASQALRNDAFQIALSLAPKKEAVAAALAALSGAELTRKKLSLAMLVQSQSESMPMVRGHLGIRQPNVTYVRTSGTPIVPEPPKGLTAGHVEPLLSDPDPEVAAQAGYLLALLGQSRGLDPLLRQWRSADKEKRRWQWLVYRAIAALDDSSRLATLREIYATLEQGEKSDFYWTIRIMTGPEMLEFRKQIREETGMNNLR
jgi:HEAT repeat protein/thioredoxin-like negative regulator of GroEL